MEREKLRGISIIAAEAVNSAKPRGIAIPAVRAVVADALLLTRSLSGTFSSAGSVPIRAPITIDDDDDDSGSITEEHNSDATSYGKGVDSGTDDGFESVSGDADDETELEGLVMDGLRVHGVLGEESVGENGDASDFSGGSVAFRPLAGDVEEEASVNYSFLEEVSENSVDFEGVSEGEVSEGVNEADGDGMKAKVVIPRAILSLDDEEGLGSSGDEETVLMRVTRAPGDEVAQVEDRMLPFRDMGMVDGSPECSRSVLTDVVSTEDEAVEMKGSNRLDDLSLSVPPGGSDDFMVQSEASIGLNGSSKQLIEEGVVHRTIIEEDGSGFIHESDALMKPGDVEGVEDSAGELGEREMPALSEGSGTVTTGELVSTEEDMVQVNLSEDGSVSFETGLGVAPGDGSEFVVESEGNAVDADKGLDDTFSKLVEQGVGEESISKESANKIDDGSACAADEPVTQGEGSIGLGSRESEDEETGFMIGEADELAESACSAVRKLENPGCEGEHEIGMSSESSQVTPTQDSSNQKADQETENEGIQVSEDTDRKLSLPDEDRASSLRSSFEMASESVENGEKISEQVNKQVDLQSDSEPNQISVVIEETSLLSVKDDERTIPENSCVTANEVTENETQIARLIHNHTCMELDDYEGTGDTKEKLSESTFENHSEELSSDQSLQLISGKVKERVEKTKLLKEKLQRLIRAIDLCNEDSAVTEVESQQSPVGEEPHTSLDLDHMYEETKTTLPEQELPLGLDFSINILVIGKTGVGKSATINSIFGETKSAVGAFRVTTKSADYVVGNVGGILIKILDTPGLMSSATEEWYNQEVLTSIKKSMRRFPVDVVLYIDRLDENPDMHILRTITASLGSSIWRNAIVVLTHADSDVPESSGYKDFIAQRTSYIHELMRQAVPELSKMPGIVLAENNMSSLCGNETSESTCPDWRLNLLILCCSIKIRCKSGSLSKQNSTLVEKPDALGYSQIRSFTLFCSLWNVLLVGSNQGKASQSLDDLEKKKRRLLESYPEILWDEQNQEPEDEERRYEEEKRNKSVRRRGRLGFQATKRLGIYLDTCDLRTGFSMGNGGSRKVEQEEGKMLVKMRGSLSVLGVVHVLMSVITCVYGRKDT